MKDTLTINLSDYTDPFSLDVEDDKRGRFYIQSISKVNFMQALQGSQNKNNTPNSGLFPDVGGIKKYWETFKEKENNMIRAITLNRETIVEIMRTLLRKQSQLLQDVKCQNFGILEEDIYKLQEIASLSEQIETLNRLFWRVEAGGADGVLIRLKEGE